MPSNLLLLLPLLGGYLFNHFCHRLRFRAQALSGHRLVFEAAVSGLFFLVPARIITSLLLASGWLKPFLPVWAQLTGSTQFVGTTVLAVTLAPTSAVAMNLCIGWWQRHRITSEWYSTLPLIPRLLLCWLRASRDYSLDKAIEREGNSLQSLLHRVAIRGFDEGMSVGLTMGNGKIYAAWVTRSPNLSQNDQFVGLLPVMSGYREEGTLDVRYTHAYPVDDYFESSAEQDFTLTVPISEIRSAHILQEEYYLHELERLTQDASAEPTSDAD